MLKNMNILSILILTHCKNVKKKPCVQSINLPRGKAGFILDRPVFKQKSILIMSTVQIVQASLQCLLISKYFRKYCLSDRLT